MTKKEMSEIFSVMMLAWPGADLFKGGVQKLNPTIELWTSCLADLDFWIGKCAVVRLCRECKFPPTIAEFREKATNVKAEIQEKIGDAFSSLKSGVSFGGSVAAYFSRLPEGNFDKEVIRAMGGPESLIIDMGKGESRWNLTEFENTYWKLLKKTAPPRIGEVENALSCRKEG